jgi:septum formation protein
MAAMTRRRLVLASASPARLRLLRDAGLDPEVVVSGVDESGVDGDGTADLVLRLAGHKARAVAERVGDAIVVGCDSLLDLDGVGQGKPATAAEAAERWRRMRGRSGVLMTGHCVVDASTGAAVSAVAGTAVHFGCPSDDEIEAYVATGEPLGVAGAFTLDGRSAPFIDSIEGDAGTVIGLSLPLLRDLLRRLDIRIVDLWAPV